MSYRVIDGKLVNKSTSSGGSGCRRWDDDDVTIVSREPWKKSAAYKNKRARKQK
ncbi:hypothetical protein Erwinia_phage_Aioli_00072 [Erwinia phage Aioli]|nr:hypothetical protein Erwinia_phage_Aioli_00072 [Erwinia phage Aioli]